MLLVAIDAWKTARHYSHANSTGQQKVCFTATWTWTSPLVLTENVFSSQLWPQMFKVCWRKCQKMSRSTTTSSLVLYMNFLLVQPNSCQFYNKPVPFFPLLHQTKRIQQAKQPWLSSLNQYKRCNICCSRSPWFPPWSRLWCRSFHCLLLWNKGHHKPRCRCHPLVVGMSPLTATASLTSFTSWWMIPTAILFSGVLAQCGTFIIIDENTLVKQHLPKFFNMSNFRSFTKQLNSYGFTKVKNAPTPPTSTAISRREASAAQ